MEGRGRKNSGTTRAILREATGDVHRRLDDGMKALDLRAAPDYARFLAATAAALLPLETALQQAGIDRLLSDWPRRRRSEAILTDLRQLGTAPALRLRADWIDDEASMLGAAYVLEGSRLGGVLLRRQAQAASDPRLLAAGAFLAHGRDEDLWPSFVAVLDTWRPDGEAQARAALSAGRSFALFEVAARAVMAEPNAAAGD